MKKSYIVLISSFFLLLSVFAISGCVSNDNDNGLKIDDFPLDRRIGSIVSLGTATTSSHGTHLLKMDDGDTILLKSVSINLEDAKFKDKFVEVKGVLTEVEGDKPIMEVINIDVIENHVVEESAVTSWKPWTGDLFQINYMDDFEVDASENSVSFTKIVVNDVSEMKDVVLISFEKKDGKETLADKLGISIDESSSSISNGLIESKIGRQNITAYKKGNPGDSMLVYYAEDDSYFYTISFEAGNKDDQLKSENIFYEMLSSFNLGAALEDGANDAIFSRTLDVAAEPEGEIVTPEEPNNFTLLESDTFGFDVSYPKNWYFEGSSGSGSDVQRHYEFGKEPLDEGVALVALDLLGSTSVSGFKVSYGDMEFTKVVTGSVVEIYYSGKNRTYRFTGNAENETLLLQMAASLIEK